MDDDAVRDRLSDEQERLEGLRQGFHDDGLTTESESENLGELSDADQHHADTGTETFDRERDLSLLEQIEAELAEVERALARLDDGSYGTCEACGERIADDRLEAMPAARYCLTHQQVAERQTR